MNSLLATLSQLRKKKEILIGYTYIIDLSTILEELLHMTKIRIRIAGVVPMKDTDILDSY